MANGVNAIPFDAEEFAAGATWAQAMMLSITSENASPYVAPFILKEVRNVQGTPNFRLGAQSVSQAYSAAIVIN